jgi:tetratricopeptide (TPR) repeat protein
MYDPMTMICKGFLFFAQGDYDNSEMYFSNISESDHTNTNTNKNIIILAKLGRALNSYNKCNYSKAIEYYHSLIRDFDYINENILESLGICYYNLGNLKKANEVFRKVLEMNNRNFKVYNYLFTIELSQIEKNLLSNNSEEYFNFISGDKKNLIENLQKLKESYNNEYNHDESSVSNFPFLLINLANVFLFVNKIEQAEEICNKLNSMLDLGEMKIAPRVRQDRSGVNISSTGNTPITYRRDMEEIKSQIFCINAKILHIRKKTTDAFTYYSKAVQANSKNIEAQFGLGQINFLINNLSEAEKCFEACKVIQEVNIAGASGNKKSLQNVNQSGIHTPNEISFEINKYLAFIYARTRRKEIDRTVEMFSKALEIKKDDTDCYLELAQLLEFRKPEESLKLYEEVLVLIREKLEKNKENKNKDNSLSNTTKNYNTTSHNFYNIEENLPEILNNTATIKIRLNLLTDVDKLLHESLTLIKKRKEVINISKNQTQEDEKNISSSNSNSDKLFKLNSLEQAVSFNLGLLKESKCEFDEAYKYYKNLIRVNPYFIEAYVKLGELARIRGNKRKARDYFIQAVEKHFKKEKEAVEKLQKTSENKDTQQVDPSQLQSQSQENSKNKLNISSNSTNNKHKDKDTALNLSRNLSLIATLFPTNSKLIPIMKKPIDPLLLIAQLTFESGNESEAIHILNSILKVYDNKDPYTLVFLGNIFYDMAVTNRFKEDFTRHLNKSLEFYYLALEADKYNAYAAIGIANVLSEYNYLPQAMETYKMILDKQINNHNAHINEALIYMSQNNFEKAASTLTKLLKRFFKNKNPEIENLLAKIYIELKDYEKSLTILKSLMLRQPDNIYYKFNYALTLKSKAEEVFLKSDRRVRETEDAIKNIEKAIPIFESLFSLRKEISANFKSEKDDRNLKSSDFYNKCSEVLQFLHLTLINSRETLEKDKLKENEILNKIEENRRRYNMMLENMKEMNEIEKEELKRKMAENEKLADSFKEKMDKIIESKIESEKEKNQKKKKKNEKGEDEENIPYEDSKQYSEKSNNENDDLFASDNNEEHNNIDNEERKKKKKKKKSKKRRRDEDNIEEFENENKERKKLKKLRKKHKEDDDDFDELFNDDEQREVENNFENENVKTNENNINDFDTQKEENYYGDIVEENLYGEENKIVQEKREDGDKENDVNIKDYSRNENEDEVDFS